MFDLGTQELIVIFIVAFLVFGPKKLPELGRTLGKGMRELKAAMRGVKDSFDEAGNDVTEELKEARSDLEDSVYKAIDPAFKGKVGEDEAREKEETQEGQEMSKNSDEEEKGQKETDRDG